MNPTKQILRPEFQIIRLLGSGATGTVYLARDLALHRVVAIKVLHPNLAEDPIHRNRFRTEARLAAHLHHPRIVPIYSWGEKDGIPYQVSRFVRGETLAARLAEVGALSATEVARMLWHLADALAHAHGEGIVHRDLKPANVVLEAETGLPALTDFGVALRSARDDGPGQARRVFGTSHFMSPEQAVGDHDVDHRSDIFALGVLGYLTLAGTLPYEGESHVTLTAQRVMGNRVPLGSRIRDPSPRLVGIIERCLAPERTNRWQRVSSLRDALAEWARSRGLRHRFLRWMPFRTANRGDPLKTGSLAIGSSPV